MDITRELPGAPGREAGQAEFDLLVVGDLNADLILQGEVTPAFGQVERLLDDASLVLGSSAAICACGAARLGLRVALVGRVGDDDLGRLVLRALAAAGVDTAGVIVDPADRTGLTVVLARREDRAILTYLGASGRLRAAEVDPGALGRARHLHVGGYYLLPALRPGLPALLGAARARGLSVSLDTNYDPAEGWGGLDELLPLVDIFLPNEAELLAASGLANVAAAADRLAARVPTLAVKLGAAGALARRGALTVAAAPPAVAVVDTTGAGDSFDAGFIYGHLAGWELGRALAFAAACGALACRGAGGTASQPTLDEVLACC